MKRLEMIKAEVSTMLSEYEKDHNTGMDIMAISNEIYGFTSGYPFLVSRICQIIDEELEKIIIELKIWRELEENKNAYEQLLACMSSKNANVGYFLTFDFRKNKERKIAWESFEGKQIFDVVV